LWFSLQVAIPEAFEYTLICVFTYTI